MTNIKLQYPINVENEAYDNITMRRSKVKDRLAVSSMKNATDEEKEIRLFANLCEVSTAVISELDEIDYNTLQKTYMAFFGSEGTLGEK
ncbi:MAG: phage tail assembly protein [Alphaproteobacteria bacterium]